LFLKLAILSTHPIQYNAPLFALMTECGLFELRVFYTWGEKSINSKYDPDFGRVVEWDIPLLEGYQYQFVKNSSKNPGSHHFSGIENPHLIQDIEAWGADIIWVWGWSFKSHLKVIRHFHSRIPVWFRGDSTLIDEGTSPFWKRRLRKFFLSWVYKKVDLAFYVGDNNKKYFLQHGLITSKLTHAPHAIDNARFSYWNEELESDLVDWKESLGIAENDLVVLFVGKLEPKKNPNFILDLATQLPSKKFKFLIIGGGVLDDELKQNAKQDKRILFLPFQNQTKMPSVYRLGDVFVLPSLGPGETWGLAMNEAMACGIPLFGSTKCGGSIDLIDDSCGLIFDPSDLNAVVNQLNILADNPDTLANLKVGAIKKIQYFRYEKIVDAVIEGIHRSEQIH
jgi:glycosyltransferase involved in cell wall biosynthesis